MKSPLALCAVVAMAACVPSTHSYRYDAPDGLVSLAVEPEGKREAASGRRNDVYLLGAFHSQAPGDVGPRVQDRVRIGSFTGLWNLGAIAWVDGTTVNVCPLEGDRTVPATVSVLVTETQRRTHRITTDCPDFLREAAVGKLGLPKSY